MIKKFITNQPFCSSLKLIRLSYATTKPKA